MQSVGPSWAQRTFAGMVLALCLSACVGPSPTSRYEDWRQRHAAGVSEFERFLAMNHVAGVAPTSALLRSGRRWQACGVEEFVLPPASNWPHILPALRLFDELQREGLLRNARIASGFRSAAHNRCEGGAASSRHLGFRALDLDIDSSPEEVSRLCRRWRQLGPARRWGLGFYQPDRIHIDAEGFRTWGSDHHAGSSLCNMSPH